MSLSEGERTGMNDSQVKVSRTYVFGTSRYEAVKSVRIPCVIKGMRILILTEIVRGNVPWLIGCETLERLGVSIDLAEGRVRLGALGGVIIPYSRGSGSHKNHICIELIKGITNDQIWFGNLEKEWLKDKKLRRQRLKKIHLQFGHGNWKKVFDLLCGAYERANLGKTLLGEIEEELKDISEQCDVCQRYKVTPARPVVGLPMAKVFNEVVAMDLGELEGRKFLVMVDMATRFCQAAWIPNKKPSVIVQAIVEKWLSVFGAPDSVLSDNGLEFQNPEVRMLYERFNIRMLTTAVYSPWSNGLCERMVGLLKDTMRKLRSDLVDWDIILGWSVVAKNTLTMRGGFSPCQLVFGRNTGVPSAADIDNLACMEKGGESQYLLDTMLAMRKSREIFVSADAEDRVRRALLHNTREHPIELAVLGEWVNYKRDGESQWRGPARVVGVDGKTVFVKHGSSLREVQRVHITRLGGSNVKDEVNPVIHPRSHKREVNRGTEDDSEEESDEESGQVGERAGETMQERVVDVRERLGVPMPDSVVEELPREPVVEELPRNPIVVAPIRGVEGIRVKDKVRCAPYPELGRGRENLEVRILSRAAKVSSAKGRWKDSYNVEDLATGNRFWIDLRQCPMVEKVEEEEETLLCWMAEDGEVVEAKLKELESWRSNNVYMEVDKGLQKALSCRWIVTKKTKEGKEICKARLVVRGFEEEPCEFRTDAPTCSTETIKICVSVICCKGWKCRSLDIKTAYLQGDPVERTVFVKPPKEAMTNGVWKLRKAAYGLKDAARVWYLNLIKHVEQLGGKRTLVDNTLFYWKKGGKLEGIMCSHVDDLFYGETDEFVEVTIGELRKRLKVGTEEQGV
jgi:hypothetical protein